MLTQVLEQLVASPAFQRPISVSEYHRMIDVGLFDEDGHVELIEGVLVRMTPQSAPHAQIITLMTAAFSRALPETFAVRVQLPLTLGGASEPEPDLAVVRAQEVSSEHHPRRALLVIEVATSSLSLDRQVKGELYARARIPEYWIINTADRCVEVYTRPDSRSGKYRSIELVDEAGTVTPRGCKGPRLTVRVLLGKPRAN